MPILRFDLIEGRDEKSVTQLLDAAHDAVVKALGVPARDRYQIVRQHPAHELIVQDTGLGIERTKNVFAGMKVTLIGLGGSMPGGRSPDEFRVADLLASATERKVQDLAGPFGPSAK